MTTELNRELHLLKKRSDRLKKKSDGNKKENTPCLWLDNGNVMASLCRGKFAFAKKNKGEQTEIKMNNDARIISIKAEILSNWVSQKSKNIIKLAAERLF